MESPYSRLLRSEKSVALAAALATALAVMGLRAGGLLEPLEMAVYDRLLHMLPEPEQPGSRVIVVEYTERDIQEQQTFPLPDGTLARVISTILDQEPRVVGVDLYREILIPPGSEDLEALLERDPRVVMIHRLGGDGVDPIPPPAVLVGTDRIGFADLVLDRDDTVRRAILYQDDDEHGTVLSLGLRVALQYLAAEGVGLGLDPDDPERLLLGPTPLRRFEASDGGYAAADDAGYQQLVDFEGAKPFRSIAISDVLRGAFEPADFRDKMVFVGVTADTHSDLIRVPFGQWPGVFVHGHVASQSVRYGLGEDRPLATWSDARECGWIVLWAALGAGLGLAQTSVWVFAMGAVAGVGLLAGAGFGALLLGWWIPVGPPALAWLASASGVTAYLSRRERAERAALMQLFSRYVSRHVACELWEQREQFLQGGRPRPQRLTVTSLFVDVKDSTPLAEKLEPLLLMQWLNRFMEAMAAQAEHHGGIVDDYFGDGMKADFGVPVARTSDAQLDADAAAAVDCALAMRSALEELNIGWHQEGLPEGALRVGIDTGPAVAGSLGSSDRLTYTVIGDTVNTAARIQGLDDSEHDYVKSPARILVSARTRARLGDQFAVWDRGEFALKGKANRVRIFEVMNRQGSGSSRARSFRTHGPSGGE